MITLKNVTTGLAGVVSPTVFPDKTSQVWKIEPQLLDIGAKQIIWHFEGDHELIQILQLVTLIRNKDRKVEFELIVPFLPYGRQDKDIQNDTTFGLHIFLQVLGQFDIVARTYDAHNSGILKYSRVKNVVADKYVKMAIEASQCDLVCFPDKGAANRGYVLNGKPSFFLSKTRDQSTGAITGMVCELPLDLKGKKILIVDDIICGGRTFIEATKILKSLGAEHVSLYCTHGIFSQGVHVLSNIDHIYVTDSYKTSAKLTDKVTVFKLEI